MVSRIIHPVYIISHSYSDVNIYIFFASSGTKEAAFYYAITRAAMAYQITKSCTKDEMVTDCGCDDKLKRKPRKLHRLLMKNAAAYGYEDSEKGVRDIHTYTSRKLKL